MSCLKYLVVLLAALVLSACGGGGGNASAPPAAAASAPVTASSANASVASIQINASSSSLKSDGTSIVTFTVFALTSGNAAVSGAQIDLSATNGVILSNSSVVSTSSGATVTMIAASSNQVKRISTVTASCTGCSASPATSQINVIGASIALANVGPTSLISGGSGSILTATVTDVSGLSMSGIDVVFSATDPSILGLSVPTTAKTNPSGVATVTVSGLTPGSANINVTAMGDAKSQAYSSALAAGVLAVTSPANNAVIVTNIGQTISVSAPTASLVTFATTRGTFGNGAASQTVPVVAGIASAVLTSVQAGTATVSLMDSLSRSLNLTLVVSPPVAAVNKVLLNASQTSLPVASALGAVSSLTITARAVLFDGATDQSVANVPVEFAMAGGPGAGEFLTPALAYTNSAGYAVATFTAGTAASIPNGIVISAKVQGTAVQTGVSPSNNNVALTIGGQSMSVAFGPASVLGESADKTLYTNAYSVQVTDANNNPVKDQVVTLRLRPVAFSLGGSCAPIATYCSEDWNGNGSLESSVEDGVRIATTEATAGSCPTTAGTVAALNLGGTPDGLLTPPNSDGGSVPSIVTTDVNGIAAFNLTYLKGSAFWIVDKLTATVSSNGTETSKSTIFRLAASVPDVGPPCFLPASPYSY